MSVSAPAPVAPSRARPEEALGHLVISRRELESVQIGDDVVVEILAVEGSTVRLRITAPKSVRILRGELGPR
jgi:carbon storage regulator CsrA